MPIFKIKIFIAGVEEDLEFFVRAENSIAAINLALADLSESAKLRRIDIEESNGTIIV